MSSDIADVAGQLAAALGGRVTGVHRLSGGASRITSAVDLEIPSGAQRSLVLQQVRGTGLTGPNDVRMEADLLRTARMAGVPVPDVVAAGAADGLPRVAGGRTPRRRDHPPTHPAG